MKKLITPLVILLALLIAGVVGYAVSHHYEAYKARQASEQRQEQAKQDTGLESRIRTLTTERDNAWQRIESITVECQKGAAAYANLSATFKRNLEAPNCPAV